ncbi:MAG: LON peptidase substrate-binding domain-containing protein [Hylemonella sp.]|uniref:LON peptidase substrate-binding domain-containing protein n=1 Tax=Hylemonella sp. TaxID=2066020 RepID=UPI0022CA6BCA|nr:LON peptidase substrate-binding domain-containing protein [Hylemonella sp.]MCZ8252701.1 LON peptidase substrate-binding domain-containing protein [Hylemonella sp.]
MPDTFQLPLFPLQTVLFPGGVLPLRIFEVRYLDLIQRCQKEGAPFGVVCLTQGSEVRQAPGEAASAEAFHPIGTLAHIEAYERPQPGLMLIRCRGGRRFRLLRSEQMKHGLWTGEAEYLADDPVVPVPQDLVPVRVGLQRLLQHMQAQAQPGDELPIQAPLQWDDCGWVAHRWCDILPVSPQLKQQFLAVDNPLIRLELVGDLLARLKIGTGPE